jgi:tetratricopeptide (TPR) repeat protein
MTELHDPRRPVDDFLSNPPDSLNAGLVTAWTVAAVATLLLAVALGGGWVWIKADHQARQAQVTRQVHEALNRATALREQGKAAPVGSAALFAQAREQAQRALALAENAQDDAAQVEPVQQLQAELDQEGKDRQLLAALEAARLAQAETVVGENRFASERAVPLFREAFAAYGLKVGQGEPVAAAARLRQRPEAIRQVAVAALQEWVDLAEGPKRGLVEPHLDWLRAVAVALEADQGWARDLRVALEEKDLAKRRAVLEKLARETDLDKVPVRALTRLAVGLRAVQAPASAVALLRRAQQRYPADFWVNHDLGTTLLTLPGEAEAAVRYLTAAVALRPDSPGSHLNLGAALKARGQLDEAIACYRQAIRLDPKYAMAHANLGTALKDKGQLEEAIACWRVAIALDPKSAGAYSNLGVALEAKGQREEAITCYRKAIALDPSYAKAHSNLGVALKARGQLDEAIACYRRAIQLNPRDATAHNNLGVVLQAKGQLEEAIACYRQAIALDPKDAGPHNNLGLALLAKGQLEEASACFRKSIELDPRSAPAHTNLARAQRLVTARDKLPGFRNGSYVPATTEERLALAEWCALKKLHHTAAGLYATAFAADPKLADDLNASPRYQAACQAALAAAGMGEDAAKLDAREQARLRQQALDWLRTELTARQKQLLSARPGEADQARAKLRHWQQDTDLAGLRDEAALAKLPAQQREACRRLWADVAELLKSKDSPTPKEPKP